MITSERPSVAMRILRWVFLPKPEAPKGVHWEKNERGEWELHIPEWLIRR
jgi:hypothetical protein